MKKSFLSTAVVLLAASVALAQGSPSPKRPSLHPDMFSRHLMFDIDAEGFFFDAEYDSPFAKGFTVTGFRLSPTLIYGINERASLRVGFNATLFAGMDSLYMLRPTLSLSYRPLPWLNFIAGTLSDNNHHQLPAPVIDPSQHIFNYQEDGIQILTDTRLWQSDTWLDWTHYLVPWTPDQELFTMGSKHEFHLLHIGSFARNPKDSLPPTSAPSSQLRVSLPAHFLASHRGGEVKTIDTNTVTTFNESVGLHIEYRFRHSGRYGNMLCLDLPLFFYHLEDTELDHGGKAFYPSLSYRWTSSSHNTDFSIDNRLGFWHGDHYFSAYGSPLFWSDNEYSRLHMPQSASTINASSLTTAADSRDIITYSLSVVHSFKTVSLGLGIDAFHDLNTKNNDFIFSFFLHHKMGVSGPRKQP